MDNKRVYEVAEVLRIIPISRSSLYAACNRNEIPVIRIGKRMFIPGWWVEQSLAKPPLVEA